jgi:hypothetical protein
MPEQRSDLMEQPSTKGKFQCLKGKLSKSPSETETSADSALRDQVDDAPLRIRAALDVALRRGQTWMPGQLLDVRLAPAALDAPLGSLCDRVYSMEAKALMPCRSCSTSIAAMPFVGPGTAASAAIVGDIHPKIRRPGPAGGPASISPVQRVRWRFGCGISSDKPRRGDQMRTLRIGPMYQALAPAARAGARESCADFRAGVWNFNPKPE